MGGTIAQYGRSIYVVDDSGYISAIGQEPSGAWQIIGAERYNNFGKPVEYLDFHNLHRINGQWRYKNGAQKWFLVDLDHGTKRVWRSPIYACYFFPLPTFSSTK